MWAIPPIAGAAFPDPRGQRTLLPSGCCGVGCRGFLLFALGTGSPLLAGDFDADGRQDLAAIDLDGGGARLFPNRDGVFGAASHVDFPGFPSALGGGDVDGDGGDDLVLTVSRAIGVARTRAVPVARDCTADATPDVCEASFSDCNANGTPDTCELSSVDADGDDVPDCVERDAACGNCRDDDADGALDLDDDVCPSATFGRARLVAAPVRGAKPGRIAIAADATLTGAVDLATTPPLLTVRVGGATVYCDRPALVKRGRTYRLAAADDRLSSLAVTIKTRKPRFKLKAKLTDAALAAAPGAAASVGLRLGTETLRGAATLQPRGRRLVGRVP